jgi:ribosomal protein S18 acetylase RimI-like enzyme
MKLIFKVAQYSDLETLLPFAQEFNQEDHHPFTEAVARTSLTRLLDNPAAGRVWLIQIEGETAGYLVLTLGYRLTYGRYAFIDEIYVRPAYRSQRIGRRAIAFAEALCRERGVRALHLEVERENSKARALYTALGFVDYGHYLMTCWLAEENFPPVPHSPEAAVQPVRETDSDTLVKLRQQAGAGNPAEEVEQFTADETLGRAWLIQAEDRAVGYVALTFSYSLEFHGRDALLDELYVRDPYQPNLGVTGLLAAQVWARSQGIKAIHVEVKRDNEPAQALYRAAGFTDDDSYLLTKWIEK